MNNHPSTQFFFVEVQENFILLKSGTHNDCLMGRNINLGINFKLEDEGAINNISLIK